MKTFPACVLAALVVLSCHVSRASDRAPSALGARPSALPKGTLFIVGGGPQPKELVEQFVQIAGGNRARIVVIPMASASGATSGEAKAKDLRALGATAVNVVLTRAQANTDSAARLFADATGVWFGGGDQ